MKTFKQFILEDNEESLKDFLKTNCADAIKDFQHSQKILYRGGSSSGTERKTFKENDIEYKGYIKNARKNRQPMSTPIWAHEVIDNFFKKKFNIAARSAALFCTTNTSQASLYGDEVFMIFPIGNYKIIWSPTVKDLTLQIFPDLGDYAPGDLLAGGKEFWFQQRGISSVKNVNGSMQLDKIESDLQSFKYRDDDDVGALQSKSELMVICDSYLMIPMSARTDIKEWLNDL